MNQHWVKRERIRNGWSGGWYITSLALTAFLSVSLFSSCGEPLTQQESYHLGYRDALEAVEIRLSEDLGREVRVFEDGAIGWLPE